MNNYFRIIPRFEIKSRNLIKGMKMEGLRIIGGIHDKIKKYQEDGADEIIIDDIVASLYSTDIDHKYVSSLANLINIPLTIGGGIKDIKDIEDLMYSGADKVMLNSAAIKNIGLIYDASKRFGSQCIVSQVQAKKIDNEYFVFYLSGRENSKIKLSEWLYILQENGVGEIVIMSIDNDGMEIGCEVDLLNVVTNVTKVPLIYGGGISSYNDIQYIKNNGLQGALISKLLHDDNDNIKRIKENLCNKQ